MQTAFLWTGYCPASISGPRTGFYWGFCFVEPHLGFDDPLSCPSLPRNLFSRVPLFFGMKGPVIRTDTACNSSFCAFNEAFFAITSGVIDRAIVVGSNDCYRPYISMCFKDLTMINKDGRCKGLDASADGYCRSEAIVVTLLERKDISKRIYATVLGCRSNSDGFKEEGITFPSISSQSQLMSQVYRDAQIDVEEIGYVEAHLTGTAVGDPIEMQAISDVICEKKKSPLLIGCLKASIGHSEGASGLCSIAKAAIILQSKLIPPNLYYNKPNPNVKPLMQGKIAPVLQVTPLPGKLIPLNNFGFGGSNTHILLEGKYSPHDLKPKNCELLPRIVPVCGRTAHSVQFILNALTNDASLMNVNFFDILYTFSQQECSEMPFRSYALIRSEASDCFNVQVTETVDLSTHQLDKKNARDIRIAFKDECVIKNCCLKIECFNDALVQIGRLIRDSRHSKQLSSFMCQLAWAVVFKSIGLSSKNASGCKLSAFAAAFFNSHIDLNTAVLCALKANQYLSEQNIPSDRLKCDLLQITQSHETTDNLLEAFLATDSETLHSTDSSPQQQVIYPHELTAVSFVQLIGKLYTQGHTLNWPAVYPAVHYPMPSDTPSLSSLIKWKHEKTFPIAPFLIKEKVITLSGYYKYTFSCKNAEDRFLFDHVIDEKILFPATGYLMLAWNTLARMCGQSVFDQTVTFTDVKFIRATMLDVNSEIEFCVRVNYDTGNFFILQSEMEVVTGNITLANSDSVFKSTDKNALLPCESTNGGKEGKTSLHVDAEREEDVLLDSREIYREMRVRGYDYGPYFQCLSKATASGSKGLFIWRNVTPKRDEDKMTLSENAARWLRNWVVLVDTAFQLDVLRDVDDSRSLFIPTKVESIVCSPHLLNEQIASSFKFTDALSQDEAALVSFTRSCDSLVSTPGLSVKGLKTTLLKRRPQQVNTAQVTFVPCHVPSIVTGQDKHLIDSYVQACIDKTNHHDMFDLNDDSFSFLRCRMLSHPLPENAKDILFTNNFTQFHLRKHLLYPHIETVVNNLPIDESSSQLSVLEINNSPDENTCILGKSICDFWTEIVLCDIVKLSYSLYSPVKVNQVPSQIQSVSSMADCSKVNLLIVRCTCFDSLQQSLLCAREKIREDGFILICYSDLPSSPNALHLTHNLSSQLNIMNTDEVNRVASEQGFTLIQTVAFDYNCTLRTALFRLKNSTPRTNSLVQIGLHDYQSLDELRKLLATGNTGNQNERIWLVPKVDSTDHLKNITGIYGLLKTLRLEPNGHKLRCIVDFTRKRSEEVDFEDKKYRRIIERDLVFNVIDVDENGNEQIGSYQVLPTDQMTLMNNTDDKKDGQFYLRCLKPGDLTSLTWVQAGPRKHLIDSCDDSLTVKVAYCALNFRDIMFATGQLDFDAIPGITSSITQDSILGLEVAGFNLLTDQRVMGITPYQGLASMACFVDPLLTWKVPASWSLEDAATVPVVYATAYYALVIRGNLMAGESVLIHSACGGVGLAAMAICQSINCSVFATVGSKDKVDFLLSKYPSMKGRIFNSRSTDFADELLKYTDGKGVDVILNSLSEEKLQASLTCLADNGRFLELGKVDFVKDHKLFTHQMDENKSFHGVLLDALFIYRNRQLPHKIASEKKYLHYLMKEGIASGVVKPLDRSVFSFDQVENAFRYMAAGKHIGKVVLQMQANSPSIHSSLSTVTSSPLSLSSSCVSSCSSKILPVTYFEACKVYIVLGGLGGFGLECANWLISKGGRNVILTSRNGIRDSYQRYSINRMKKKGCKVTILTYDASVEGEAKMLLEQANTLAPVGGIFNCAVVYEDKLFQDTDAQSLAKVCNPKSLASLHLDKWSRILCPQLDYFVTISSLSAGRGNPGQAAYNLANFAMESLSLKRHRQGLPALSVEWGVIGDTGIVAETSKSNEMVLLGTRAQRLHSCFDTLGSFLQESLPVRISYIRHLESENKKGKNECLNLISIISRLLGIKDMSSIDPDITLGGLGVDSLIAVEIKQTLDKILPQQISMKEVRELKVRDLFSMSSSSKEESSP